jgi:hypothetical protein
MVFLRLGAVGLVPARAAPSRCPVPGDRVGAGPWLSRA